MLLDTSRNTNTKMREIKRMLKTIQSSHFYRLVQKKQLTAAVRTSERSQSALYTYESTIASTAQIRLSLTAVYTHLVSWMAFHGACSRLVSRISFHAAQHEGSP